MVNNTENRSGGSGARNNNIDPQDTQQNRESSFMDLPNSDNHPGLSLMHCKEDLKEETEEEHDLSYVPEYLEDFSFSYFHCSKLQMQFAEYLLKYASALEKMSILIDPKGSQYPFYKGRYRGMTYWSVANTLREFDKRNILDVQTSEEIIFGSISR
ncbi:uncharacterized protein [Euphorbia lathyris]|uniref:uncharacterized protein n=1 Tax=Euphorbia lathyris TaxID=212925 RepID=UPI00331409B4